MLLAAHSLPKAELRFCWTKLPVVSRFQRQFQQIDEMLFLGDAFSFPRGENNDAPVTAMSARQLASP